jgi:polyphosphate kinase
LIIETLLADNSLARELRADGTWQRVVSKKPERRRPTQVVFMRRRQRARRLGGAH